MKLYNIIFIIGVLLLLSCKKPAGPGGHAGIKGRVYVKDFNTAAYGAPISEYYAAGEKIYICYGTGNIVGNSITSSADGSFEFIYLNKGHYTVYALSRDTSIHVAGSNKTLPITYTVDITSSSQIVSLPDFVINK